VADVADRPALRQALKSSAEAQIGLKGLFLIFSVLIFDSSVDDGSERLPTLLQDLKPMA